MLLLLVLYGFLTLTIVVLVWMIPSVYDIGSFSRVYDLFELVGNEQNFRSITKPTNIVTRYYPAPNIQTVANVTYQVDSTSNTIKLKVNNIDYTYPLEAVTSKQVIYPILLGAQ